MLLVETKRMNKEEVTVVSSLDVAETFGKDHKDVLRDIKNLGCPDDFRERNFALSKYEVEGNKRKYPMYYMTRDGFTLLVMGYTGEKAMTFKIAYIEQFNKMEKLIQSKLIEREKSIAVRNSLTNALKISTENERMHGHAYSTYTNCIYKVLFGINAKQLREQWELDAKANIRDCMSQEQLGEVAAMEQLVSGLIGCGWGYDKIKAFIEENNVKKLV